MTWVKRTVHHNSIEAEALRCERGAVISEFKELTTALMEMTGWSESVAMFVMERLILAYEIGADAREAGGRAKGEKLTAPPASLAHPWREVYALTRDGRAAALVERAFRLGWKRNKRSECKRPKKTAGTTVMELMKRTGKTENDKRERWRLRMRLKRMVEEFRSRSP